MRTPITITGLDDVKKAFGEDVISKAEAKTLNRLASMGKTAISSSVRSYWNIKQKVFNQHSSVVNTSYKAPKKVAYIKFMGKRFGLQEFPYKVKRIGRKRRKGIDNRPTEVHVQLNNKKSGYGALVLRHAWVADWGHGDRIFDRNNRSGRARRRQAPSLPDMVANRKAGSDSADVIAKKITDRRAPDIFAHNLEYYMNKRLGSQQ